MKVIIFSTREMAAIEAPLRSWRCLEKTELSEVAQRAWRRASSNHRAWPADALDEGIRVLDALAKESRMDKKVLDAAMVIMCEARTLLWGYDEEQVDKEQVAV